jgi:hypothetical protein
MQALKESKESEHPLRLIFSYILYFCASNKISDLKIFIKHNKNSESKSDHQISGTHLGGLYKSLNFEQNK